MAGGRKWLGRKTWGLGSGRWDLVGPGDGWMGGCGLVEGGWGGGAACGGVG